MAINRVNVPLDLYIRKHLFTLTIIILLTILAAMIVYGEPFFVWQYALSDLGAVKTKLGLGNTAARFVMGVGFSSAATLMARVSYRYWRRKHFSYRRSKGLLSSAAALGMLVFLYPHDINKMFHSMGAGLMIGGCYFYVNLLYFELKSHMDHWRFVLDQVFLHGSVLTYAVAYFMGMPGRQVPQKYCFLAILYSLDRVSLLGLSEVTFYEMLRLEKT